MSVPKGEQGVTSTEFFRAANRLEDEIVALILRDFGAKPVARDLRTFAHRAKMSAEDRETFSGLCEKYHIDVEADYPLWLLERFRNKVLDVLKASVRPEFLNMP